MFLISGREENILVGYILICILCHGMFFTREWLILGAFLLVYSFISWKSFFKIKSLFQGDSFQGKVSSVFHVVCFVFKNPIGVFILLILFSLLGLFNAVRSVEGWLEAFRWFIFMIAYLWGKRLACECEVRDRVLNKIIWIALISTILSLLPGSERIWLPPHPPEEGRFAFCFGYPNSAAVFLGCQLILLLKDKKICMLFWLIFAISVVSTGSRAALILLTIFCVIIILKKRSLYVKSIRKTKRKESFGFSTGIDRTKWSNKVSRKTFLIQGLTLIFMLILLQQTLLHGQSSYHHLLDWSESSFAERVVYYLDSIKIARVAHFLPQAGGWFAFPFIQNIPYWTNNPHSSLFLILINQGIIAVLILAIWAIKGITGYIKDLCRSTDMGGFCLKTAALFIGVHSLIDVDMSFGVLGILFWLLIGMNNNREVIPEEQNQFELLKNLPHRMR